MAAAAVDPMALGLGTSGGGGGGGGESAVGGDGAEPVDLVEHPSGIVPTLQ